MCASRCVAPLPCPLCRDYAKLAPLLGRLSAKLREVVDLSLEGFAYDEIAELLGIEEGAARLRFFRAVEKLREGLFPRAGPRPTRGGRRPFGRRELGWFESRSRAVGPNALTIGINRAIKVSRNDATRRRQPRRPGRPAVPELSSGLAGHPGQAACWMLRSLPRGRWCLMDYSIYLGAVSDPRPVFRSGAPDGFFWPEEAVMAVVFTREDFAGLVPSFVKTLPRTVYYGADGWPMNLEESLKAGLSGVLKKEFQVYPWDWSLWDRHTWDSARRRPEFFRRRRAQASLARALAPFVSLTSP